MKERITSNIHKVFYLKACI